MKNLILMKKISNNEEGFTLIELLVVIVIIGILSAIALPSFLNQANRARQAEARTYVGSINRGQQAYVVQSGKFATDIESLGVGIPSSTPSYNYQIATDVDLTLATAQQRDGVRGLKSLVGVVQLVTNSAGNVTTATVLCEQKTANDPPTQLASAECSADQNRIGSGQ